MSLRITRAIDPITVERLVLSIYSVPGIGKTTLGFTTESPLLLDFDAGVHRAAGRKDSVQVNTWVDVSAISADDLKGYKTLVIDTAGRALDILTAEIIQTNPKLGRSGGALTLQGYGELKSRFIAFTKLIRSFGLDLVLLAHSDEQRGNGDELIERIDVTGGSKNELYKVADVMGRLFIRGGQRYLNLNPSETSFGKNPAGLPELPVPPVTENPTLLADVIAIVKTKLNQLTAAQQESALALTEWQVKFDGENDPAKYNDLIAEVAQLPEDIKANVGRLWVKVGRAKGWTQGEDKHFTAPQATPDFNPVSENGKDGITKKQMGELVKVALALQIKDLSQEASLLFGREVNVDNLSKEAATRLLTSLNSRRVQKAAA